MKNIVGINLKGGAAKTINASLIASFLPIQNEQNKKQKNKKQGKNNAQKNI